MAQVFDLLYGTTLRGKSKGIVELIRWLNKQTGKKARLYIGDGGLATYVNAGLVDAGILEVIEYDALDFPFTVMDRMVNGWAPVTEGKDKGKWAPPPANYADTHIITIFEGASVLSKYLLGSNKGGLAYRAARGELIGNKNDDALVKIKDESMQWMGGDGVDVGANTVGHYKLMQPTLLNAIKKTKRLPGWVLWTAHPVETYDKDEGGKAGDYGKLIGKTMVTPDVGGKAPGSWVSREFGNTLHFDVATKREQVKDEHMNKPVASNDREYRLYTRDHYDPDGNSFVEYRAGNRCAIPDMMPDYLTSSERPGDALVKFYDIMLQAQKLERESLAGGA